MPLHRHTPIVLAAALSTLAIPLPLARADDNAATTSPPAAQREDRLTPSANRPTQAPASPQLPAGITPKDIGDRDDIAEALEDVTEDVLDDDASPRSLINHLVDADRNRLGTDEGERALKAALDRADRFRQQWQAKYGKEFDPGDEVFHRDGFLSIATGEVSDPARLAGNWPVPAAADQAPGDRAQPAGASQPPSPGRDNDAADLAQRTGDAAAAALGADDQRPEHQKLFGGDRNLDRGRNVAVARLPATHGLPQLTVSLIHELPDAWRLDLPDHLTADRLRDNLTRHLDAMTAMKQWPDDINEAHRLVAHHLLMALYDVEPPTPAPTRTPPSGT